MCEDWELGRCSVVKSNGHLHQASSNHSGSASDEQTNIDWRQTLPIAPTHFFLDARQTNGRCGTNGRCSSRDFLAVHHRRADRDHFFSEVVVGRRLADQLSRSNHAWIAANARRDRLGPAMEMADDWDRLTRS